MTFSLLVNAFHVPPSQVVIGRSSQNPPGMPFAASASPALLAQQQIRSDQLRGVDRQEIHERNSEERGR